MQEVLLYIDIGAII